MNPADIIDKLNTCVLALQNGNNQLKTLAIKKAQTERDYKVKQAQEILKLKAEGYPATLIKDLVKGNEEVAKLRLERDIAESSYFTCIGAIDNLKIEIETLRSQLTWLRAEYSNS